MEEFNEKNKSEADIWHVIGQAVFEPGNRGAGETIRPIYIGYIFISQDAWTERVSQCNGFIGGILYSVEEPAVPKQDEQVIHLPYFRYILS